MKIELQFMEVGKPLFLAGTNYGEKLYPKSGKGDLMLLWDDEKNRAEVHSAKGMTYVTEPWVFTYEPKQEKKLNVVNTHHDHIIAPIVKAQVGGPGDVFQPAQVETPISKVQGKPGGKKAKYQGEETQGE